jgi:predicted house-cleaning noncanonical NTP pyrophosphatase (MazG superfamily)
MKLVRDKIPDIIKEDGKHCKYHVANDSEYKARLYEKMREELDEFVDTPCEEEAADMYEVLCAIFSIHDLNMWNIVNAASEKKLKRGAFSHRIVLEAVSETG